MLRVTRGQRGWIQQSQCAFDKELCTNGLCPEENQTVYEGDAWRFHFHAERLELRRLPFAVKGTWKYCQQRSAWQKLTHHVANKWEQISCELFIANIIKLFRRQSSLQVSVTRRKRKKTSGACKRSKEYQNKANRTRS